LVLGEFTGQLAEPLAHSVGLLGGLQFALFDVSLGPFGESSGELCGFYDETSEHGGPRERRQTDDDDEISGPEGRYDTSNPMRGIQQITRGFSKWAERYIADCGLQPARQVDRMAKWYGQMLDKLAANQA
jgi:hypothetical protein